MSDPDFGMQTPRWYESQVVGLPAFLWETWEWDSIRPLPPHGNDRPYHFDVSQGQNLSPVIARVHDVMSHWMHPRSCPQEESGWSHHHQQSCPTKTGGMYVTNSPCCPLPFFHSSHVCTKPGQHQGGKLTIINFLMNSWHTKPLLITAPCFSLVYLQWLQKAQGEGASTSHPGPADRLMWEPGLPRIRFETQWLH